MSCKEMEKELARCASGDLTDEEEFIVEVHLSACEKCRKSFELYKALESTLVSRTGERPPARAASRSIMKRLRREEPHTFVSSFWNAPAIVGSVVALSILITAALGLLFDSSSGTPQGIPGLTGLERYFTGIPDWIAGLFGGEIWLMFLVYGVMAAGFVMLGSLMTLRFVRE